MLLDILKKGVTDRSVILRIIDSADGTPETGVVFNTSGIDLWYRREGAAKTSITEATLSALTDAHSDGGFLTVGDGYYRLDLPDAAFATAANYVDVGGTVTGMVVIGGRVRLIDIDFEDTVRGGLTALPNAAAAAAGGLFTRGSGAGQINQQANGQIDVNLERWINTAPLALSAQRVQVLVGAITDGVIAAATFASNALDAVWSTAARVLTAGTNIALAKGVGVTGFNDLSAAQVNAEADTALTDYDPPTRAELTTDTNSILSKVLKYFQLALRKDAAIGADNATEKTAINADGGSGAGAFDQQTDAQEAIRDNMGTAQTGDNFARLGAPAGASVSADVAAVKVDTAAVKAKTDNLPTDPADASVVAGLIAAVEAKVDIVDTVVDAVQAKTDNLPSDPADQSLIIAATNAIVALLGTPAGASLAADIAAIEAQTDDIGAAGAGLTALASAANLATLDGKIDTIDNFLDTEIAALIASSIVRTGTAQAGAAGTITLDAGASAVDDFYTDQVIVIASGTGAGQARFVSDYVGATKVATVATWATNPDNTSVFFLLPFGAIPGASAPTAAQVADAVWDEAIADHSGGAGSTAEQLAAAGAAGDPWATPIPGAYAAGQAGQVVGDNLNATVGSRASQASVDTVDDLLDTEVAAIKAKTDQLVFTTANQVDARARTLDNDVITAATIAPDAIGASELAAGAAAEVATAVRAELATELGRVDAAITTRASQASVDDLPTNAELATALAAADDAVLAAIAALNNLSITNIRTAVGLASANLDTQLGDLPTNTELTAALAAADDAVLAAVAALNNLSQANIRTAVGLASANLDTQLDALPTNAELATALGTADDAVLSAIAALNNLSAAQVNAEADTAIADAALATAAALALAKTAIDAIKLKTDTIPASPAAVGDIPTVGAIADAVYDEATSGHAVAGSYGDKFGAHLPAILKAVFAAGSTTTSLVLNATTGIDGAAPSSVDDFYNGAVVVFTSGVLAGQRTSISDYNGTTMTLTVVALTSAPAAADRAVIV